jgi:hypothetical protein
VSFTTSAKYSDVLRGNCCWICRISSVKKTVCVHKQHLLHKNKVLWNNWPQALNVIKVYRALFMGMKYQSSIASQVRNVLSYNTPLNLNYSDDLWKEFGNTWKFCALQMDVIAHETAVFRYPPIHSFTAGTKNLTDPQ